MDNLDFYKYVNDISILVITPIGKLKRLYCPFTVKEKKNKIITNLFIVDKIVVEANNEIGYLINGIVRSYNEFLIVAEINRS